MSSIRIRQVLYGGLLPYCIFFFIFIITGLPALCQLNPAPSIDSLDKKQIRKQNRIEFKKTKERNYIRVGMVGARLDTEVSFEFPDKYLIAKIGLEDDFGLPGKKSFISASYINRITPVSGIYTNYYGINRSENFQTERDIIFRNDTIPSGTTANTYFDTHVISTGYLFSINKDPDAYLGAFFNIYFMWLNTGIKSQNGNIDVQERLIAPLPNIGMLAMFKLVNWLYLSGDVSFFSLHTDDLGGSLYSFSAKLLFKPVSWFAFDISYQEFDIEVDYPYEEINIIVNYNFRGPAFGINFSF